MLKLQLTGRRAAVAGVTAAATVILAAAAAPALAAEARQTSCTDQVRVRSQPSASAPVVGSCKAGEKVTVDESRGGFTHLVNKKGWVSSQYLAGKPAGTGKAPAAHGAHTDGAESDSTGPSAGRSADRGFSSDGEEGRDSADGGSSDGDSADGDSSDGNSSDRKDSNDGRDNAGSSPGSGLLGL
jgi:hypothetical protein